MRIIGLVVLWVAVFLVGVAFLCGLTQVSLWGRRYFGPQAMQIDREIYVESAAYNEGMIKDLSELALDYSHGTETQRDLIKATVRQRFAAFPVDRLPSHLRTFYDEVMR